jgi:hypothetical protein
MADADTPGLNNGYPPYLEMCRRITLSADAALEHIGTISVDRHVGPAGPALSSRLTGWAWWPCG